MDRELVDAVEATKMLGLKHKTGVHQYAAMGRLKIAQEIPCNGGKQKKYLFFRDDIEALIKEREFNKTSEGKRLACEKGHRMRGRQLKPRTEGEEVCSFDNKLALFFICGRDNIGPRKSTTAIRIGEEI